MDPSTPSPPAGDHGLDEALNDCITWARGDGISLQEALARIGPASFCFVCILLAIPFLQPLPLGPYTMASGITFMAAGWQMARGHATPTLPAVMRKSRIHGGGWVKVLHFFQRLLRVCRKFTRPRLEHWVTGPNGTRRTGWLIFTGGLLLALPMANLPFNNSLPALMIIFAAVAWIERDGLMIIVSLAWGVLTMVYFALVAKLLWVLLIKGFGLLMEAFHWIKSHLPTLNF